MLTVNTNSSIVLEILESARDEITYYSSRS